jgi:hypothetical protein
MGCDLLTTEIICGEKAVTVVKVAFVCVVNYGVFDANAICDCIVLINLLY